MQHFQISAVNTRTYLQVYSGESVFMNFTFMWPCIVTNFFLITTTDALNSQINFVKKLYMFRAVLLPIIRSFPLYFRHWFMSCRIDDSFKARPGRAWKLSSNLHDIY